MSQLTDQEVALIKTMLAQGMSKQDIHAHFSVPGRSINPARINEIHKGSRGQGVQQALDSELEEFLAAGVSLAHEDSEAAEDPLSDKTLLKILAIEDESSEFLTHQESETVEYKKNFSSSNNALAEYSRSFAGFANNSGGYMFFGVAPDRKVVGLSHNKFDECDPATISSFLRQSFSHELRWTSKTIVINAKKVSVIYVFEDRKKPVICSRQVSDRLKEGDIYYRYVGETVRIKYPELLKVIDERVQAARQEISEAVTRITMAGEGNVALLDTAKGQLDTQEQSFLIDEELLPKLKFVEEGSFTEKSGAPSLRLIGDVVPISMRGSSGVVTREVPMNITDRDIYEIFLAQSPVEFPLVYLEHVCHEQAIWLPIYYFIELAGISVQEALVMLSGVATTKPVTRSKIVDRLKRRKSLRRSLGPKLQELAEKISVQQIVQLRSDEEAKAYLNAVLGLGPDNVELSKVLRLVNRAYSKFSDSKVIVDRVRYAAAHLDEQFYGKEI